MNAKIQFLEEMEGMMMMMMIKMMAMILFTDALTFIDVSLVAFYYIQFYSTTYSTRSFQRRL